MQIFRSWPAQLPNDRAYVMDLLPLLLISNYDYTPLGDIDDDVVMVEWDMAVAADELEAFAEVAKSTPDKPLVAPYKLYHVADQPVWAHRVIRYGPDYTRERWIDTTDRECDYFGFGLVYLTRQLIRAFLAAPAPDRGAPLATPGGYHDTRFHDQTFSVWYRHRYEGGGPVRILWSVRPVHLHGTERWAIGHSGHLLESQGYGR